MSSVSPIKQSPIASYLSTNKAISKRSGNVWHFYNKEGLYLGRQIKMEENGSSVYIREIFGEGLKRLFYEIKILAQKCIYITNDKAQLGISIIPEYSYELSHVVDYSKNEISSMQKEKFLDSKRILRAIDENVNVGIYDVEKPYKYHAQITQDSKKELPRYLRIPHTIH